MNFTLRDSRKAPAMLPILAAGVRRLGASVPSLLACFGLMTAGAACKADLPQQVSQDAGVAIPCSIYVDQLVSFNPAGGEGGSELGEKALGPPDSDSIALSTNATLGVAFIGLGSVVDKTGDDLMVHGALGPGAQVAVYVTFEGGELVFSGYLTPESMTIDLDTASAQAVSFLQLVGLAGEAQIDAIEAIQMSCP